MRDISKPFKVLMKKHRIHTASVSCPLSKHSSLENSTGKVLFFSNNKGVDGVVFKSIYSAVLQVHAVMFSRCGALEHRFY